MNDETVQNLLTSLNAKLDTIIKLMVLTKAEAKSQSELIWLLSLAGVQPKDIAEMLGTTPNTVRVILFTLRKKKGKGRKAQAKGTIEKQ